MLDDRFSDVGLRLKMGIDGDKKCGNEAIHPSCRHPSLCKLESLSLRVLTALSRVLGSCSRHGISQGIAGALSCRPKLVNTISVDKLVFCDTLRMLVSVILHQATEIVNI